MRVIRAVVGVLLLCVGALGAASLLLVPLGYAMAEEDDPATLVVSLTIGVVTTVVCLWLGARLLGIRINSASRSSPNAPSGRRRWHIR